MNTFHNHKQLRKNIDDETAFSERYYVKFICVASWYT